MENLMMQIRWVSCVLMMKTSWDTIMQTRLFGRGKYLEARYGGKADVFYKNTDSLLLLNEIVGVYRDMTEDVSLYDRSVPISSEKCMDVIR
ncbi:hypothetical protein CHS0354_005270 [Potamilus streckersoni]|uniref:Uncharacterized protein n=1 Tax=Potamilus streckersoni TaxID=2493646 RepID=A0AAE0S2Y8_9BIVA|nr:hypothetical protein CHS0354_005270 [Potamilus streckersoni]